jgi:hypothetical protein
MGIKYGHRLNSEKEKKREKGTDNMNTGTGALVHKHYFSPVLTIWQDKRVRIAIQVLFVIGMGYLAALGKRAHPSMGISGSSALWWLMPLIVGKIAVRKGGSGLLMGSVMALSTIPIGLNHTSFYNFGLYGCTGLALDLVSAIPRINIRNVFGAIFCATMAHLVKYGFILGMAMTSSVTRHFLVYGVLGAAGLHLAFGAASGLVGFLPYWIYTRIRGEKGE